MGGGRTDQKRHCKSARSCKSFKGCKSLAVRAFEAVRASWAVRAPRAVRAEKRGCKSLLLKAVRAEGCKSLACHLPKPGCKKSSMLCFSFLGSESRVEKQRHERKQYFKRAILIGNTLANCQPFDPTNPCIHPFTLSCFKIQPFTYIPAFNPVAL